MADGITMRLVGAAKLDRKLTRIGKKTGQKIARRALRAGGKIILAEAKSRAPTGEKGLIPPSLRLRGGKRSRRNRGYVHIVVATAAGWFRGATFYAAFLEFGHFLGSRKLGARRTFVPPKPFVGPAYRVKRQQALRRIMRKLAVGIEREGRANG